MASAGLSSEALKKEGKNRERLREAAGRAKRWDTRRYFPPVGVRLNRNKCPEDVEARNVWAFKD
jgi:hypothetical protein